MRKLILFFLLTLPVFGAVNATMVWEVRPTVGSDSANSGGFDPGVSLPGTDYSQQTSPQISYTDLIVGATTTQYTSVLHAVGSTLPGNTLIVTGGTGCTTGVFEILSNATITATVDRSLGTAASVCTAAVGGSFATVCGAGAGGSDCTTGAIAWAQSKNFIWVKSTGTQTVTSGIEPTNNTGNIQLTIEGYGTTRGDIVTSCTAAGTCPLFTTSTNSTAVFNPIGNTNTNFILINLKITVTASTPNPGIDTDYGGTNNGLNTRIYNCLVDMSGAGSATQAIYFYKGANSGGVEGIVENTELILASGYDGIVNDSSNGGFLFLFGNYIHGGRYGIYDNNDNDNHEWVILNNVLANLTRGVYVQAGNLPDIVFNGNSCYNMTNECFYDTGSPNWAVTQNNVLYGGTYGIRFNSVPVGWAQNNFYGNFSSANTLNGVQNILSNDVTLTANPFTSTSVFTLNSTAGGGAAVKAAGWPGVTPGGTGYIDGGALQSKAASGGNAPHAYVQ